MWTTANLQNLEDGAGLLTANNLHENAGKRPENKCVFICEKTSFNNMFMKGGVRMWHPPILHNSLNKTFVLQPLGKMLRGMMKSTMTGFFIARTRIYAASDI